MEWIKIDGESMSPLLAPDSWVEVDLESAPSKAFEVGQIVVCREPNGTFLVHRLVDKDRDGRFAIKGDVTYGVDYFSEDQIWGTVKGFKTGEAVPKIIELSLLDRIIAKLSKKLIGPSRLQTKVLRRVIFAFALIRKWTA